MATASFEIFNTKEKKVKAKKQLLYWGMLSICMIFGAFSSAYVVRAAQGDWNFFELPTMFIYSTVVILLSSGTMFLATSSAKKNKYSLVTLGTVLTLALGIIFVQLQFAAWDELVSENVFFTGKNSNVGGSFLYVFTLIHLLHLAGGLVALAISSVQAYRKKYNEENTLGLELSAIYWHFLGGLWVYLFVFLHLIN